MSVLELSNVKKVIKNRTIVEGISMKVGAGEVYGFLGPNGAGKTTTIRMIVGLIRPTEGNVLIGGHDIQEDRSKALEQVGTIVENPEVYSYMSGRKNLIHYARLARITNMHQRIEEVVKIVDLQTRIDDKVKKYSLGMRQRLGVAQALLGDPKLLILDEPTNGLDPAGIREFRELMRRLASNGMSVFVSSHMLSEIEQMCDRVGIINQGRMITEQNMDSLLDNQTSMISFKVNDVSRVVGLLKAQQIFVNQSEGGIVQVQLEEQQVPELIRLLVAHQVNIYSVVVSKESLENQFMKLTESSNVVVGGRIS